MTTAEPPPTEVQGRRAVRLETAPGGNLPATQVTQALQGRGGGGNGRGGGFVTEGRSQPPAHLAEELASSYLRLLPGIYQGDPFVGRFLLFFESILDPIDRQVANLSHYLDPEVAPPDLLPWLGGWLGLVMDERWPEHRRRILIARAASLYSLRGTARGMAEMLKLYTGVDPEIVQPTVADVSRNVDLAYTFTVRLTIPKGSDLDEAMVRRIVEQEKPAFAMPVIEITEE
jgi:phage tail-like protein